MAFEMDVADGLVLPAVHGSPRIEDQPVTRNTPLSIKISDIMVYDDISLYGL